MLVYRMLPLSQLAYIIPERIASTSALLRKTAALGVVDWEIQRDCSDCNRVTMAAAGQTRFVAGT